MAKHPRLFLFFLPVSLQPVVQALQTVDTAGVPALQDQTCAALAQVGLAGRTTCRSGLLCMHGGRP